MMEPAIPASLCAVCPYSDHEPVEQIVKNRSGGQISLPECLSLGKPAPCPPGRDPRRPWRECDRGYGVVCTCLNCANCNDRQTLKPSEIHRVLVGSDRSPATLAFNPSICRYHDRLLFAYRVGWGGGSLRIAELDSDFNLLSDSPLSLKFPHCSHGVEDPRLFIFRDRLHLSFCGTETLAGFVGIHVLLARLTDDFEAEHIWYPHFAKRQRMEKNWVFFEFAQQLHAVYMSSPEHLILRVDRNSILAHSTPTSSIWQGGFIRGGAAPVLHAGEWYHWFHGFKSVGNRALYSLGLLTFENRPPFRVTRMTPVPLLVADQKTNPMGAWQLDKSVVFPCGAYLENSAWVVSYGLHDQFCEIARFDLADVESQLFSVL